MKKLINIVLFSLLLTSFYSCGNYGNGELTGRKQPEWFEPSPYGMLLIDRGTFLMGPSDQEATWAFSSQTKAVSVESFWMDETEITNSEYRQFVGWVLDSLQRLMIYKYQIGLDPDFFAKQDRNGNIYYLNEAQNIPILNWDERIRWRDPDVREGLDSIFYINDFVTGVRMLNARRLNYTYFWMDYQQAAQKKHKFDPLKGQYPRVLIRKDTSYQTDGGFIINESKNKPLLSRMDFIQTKTINVYPDTMCWIRDFTYSYNEPYMKMYFSHAGYADYPVVGVSWEQATAFANWRTMLKNQHQKRFGEPLVQDFRLPKESEWEYAARGGRRSSTDPWGGPYTRKSNGCFLANFKPARGNFTADGHLIPAKVGSFPPNDFGLYDMSGNVSEWTSTAFSQSSMSFINEMNPDYLYNARIDDPDIMKRKVVRGGSWKDVGYFLQCGTPT